jgi:hypothetical protein
VRLAGSLSQRLVWEVESGTYYLAASAMHRFARWQRRASHPAPTRAVGDAAEILARTCAGAAGAGRHKVIGLAGLNFGPD